MELRTNGVFLIAGGGGPVAGAIGRVFREAGADLLLVGPREEALRANAETLGSPWLVADLSVPEAAPEAVKEVLRIHGRLDGLLHTVGGFAMAPAQETAPSVLEDLFDRNVRTLFHCCRAVLPVLLERKDGLIAAFSAGIARQGGGAGMTAYAAAKGAVRGYMNALAAEVRPAGIRVVTVYPMGTIDTPANRAAMPQADPRGWVDPEELGRALLFAAVSPPRGDLTEVIVGVRG